MPDYQPEWAVPLAPSGRPRVSASPPADEPYRHPFPSGALPHRDCRPPFIRLLWALIGIGVVAFGVFGLLAMFVASAFANANTIPQKQATLREILGYAPTEPFVFDTTTWGYGVLEFIVDEHVGLPDIPTLDVGLDALKSSPKATTVRLTVTSYLDASTGIIRNALAPVRTAPVVAQIYSWSFPGWQTAAYIPPCVSPAQAAAAISSWSDEYTCLTEAELVSLASRIADMALWAKPDWPMVARLQQLHGSAGVPVPIAAQWKRADTDDQSAGPLPSILRMEVYYLFVLPKDPDWVPPVDPAIP